MSVTILRGDVRDMLATLPADHFDCVVTSPPYWGLRDYGVAGQIGLEPTLGEHLAVMMEVMRQVRRVMKPTATLWLNYGDCYATRNADGLKTKDLCMVPNRLAIALQDDGWWVRSEIIWAKPNPMPESVTDRPATAHEKIFLLSKAPRYHYDAAAVRQKAAEASEVRWAQNIDAQEGSYRANGGAKTNGTMKAVGGPRRQDEIAAAAVAAGGSSGRRMAGFNARWDAAAASRRDSFARSHKASEGAHGQKAQHRPDREDGDYPRGEGRSLRNYEPAPVEVWPIATRPFSEAHFATFPPELAERCILAGCPKGGRVLDPFGGAGTVGLVADRHQLDCTLIELNPDYADIAQRRISADAGLFSAFEAGR